MDSNIISMRSLVCILAILGYIVVARFLRYRRRDALLHRFGYGTSKPLGAMTTEDAASIYRELSEMEFPFSFLNSKFALFRTYGIGSMSRLLVATKQITSPHIIPKRLADTNVLMFEIEGSSPSSARWHEAVARTNRIHEAYRKSGKISNEDMLYTLSLFAGEPLKWITSYEWRGFTIMEKAAIGTFWKGVGDAMEIDMSLLPSGGSSRDGWTDGSHWLDELLIWSEDYESQHMLPDVNSHKLAMETLNYILWPVPKALKTLGFWAVQSLMDDRLTKTMMLERAPQFFYASTSIALALRCIFLRYFALPRPDIWRVRYVEEATNEHGRYNSLMYGGLPIYIKANVTWRWNLQAWIFWALGKPIPGDDGDAYLPHGYDLKAIGPRSLPASGPDAATILKEKLRLRGGCPFSQFSCKT